MTKLIAGETLKDIVDEIHAAFTVTNDEIIDTSILAFGHSRSWNSRSHSSLKGVVTTIHLVTGKILDVEPMTRATK